MDANLFVEGTIFYYENSTNTKSDYCDETLNHDFIVSRPVYILDAKETSFDVYTVNILTITSSIHRVGIPINLNGYREGKILPYSIHSVHKEYLKKYIGSVSEELKKEVRQAVQYHLNFSDKIPEYLIEYQKVKSKIDSIIPNLTIRERGIYETLKSCYICDAYRISMDLFLNYYKDKISAEKRYSRKCDITRAIQKLNEIFPSIMIEEENKITYIRGISTEHDLMMDQDVRNNISINGVRTKFYPKDLEDHENYIQTSTKKDLLHSLSTNQKKVYERMDIIEKVQLLHNPSLRESYTTNDKYEYSIMRSIIERDVHEKEVRIKQRLTNGESPNSMNHINQLIIYYMNDDELERCIKEKYQKKGIRELKKTIKNQIGFLLRKTSS